MQDPSKLPALVEMAQNRDYKDPWNYQPLTTADSIPLFPLNHNSGWYGYFNNQPHGFTQFGC